MLAVALMIALTLLMARSRLERFVAGPPLASGLAPVEGDLLARTWPCRTSAIARGDDGTIYFAAVESTTSTEAAPDGSIFERKPGGAEAARIVSGIHRPWRLRVASDGLYFIDLDQRRAFDGKGTVARVDLASLKVTRLVEGEDELRDFVVAGNDVYWVAAGVEGAKGEVRRVARSGGAPETIDRGLVNGGGIAEDAGSIYWVDRGPATAWGLGSSVYEHGKIFALDPGKKPRVVADGIVQATGHLVAAGGDVYFDTHGFAGDSSGGVWSVKASGGHPTRVAPHQFVIEDTLVVDGDALLWASYEPGATNEDLERAAIWTGSRSAPGKATPVAMLYAPKISLTPRGLAPAKDRVFFWSNDFTVRSVPRASK